MNILGKIGDFGANDSAQGGRERSGAAPNASLKDAWPVKDRRPDTLEHA